MRSEDSELVQQCLAGDTDAFGPLVHKYQEMVYAYVYHKVHSHADAQDVTQEVFLRAFRHLRCLKSPHQFRSWLYTIMSNECNRWLRRRGRRLSQETPLDEASQTQALQVEPEYAKRPDDWQVDLEAALTQLPEENRIAVSLFYMSDCSLREVGEFLGVSANTVKGKLHRARQQLGEALSEQYGSSVREHRLKGGFLMQLMEQLHQNPRPTPAPTWQERIFQRVPLAFVGVLCAIVGILGLLSEPVLESWWLPLSSHVPVEESANTVELAWLGPATPSPPIPGAGPSGHAVRVAQVEGTPPLQALPLAAQESESSLPLPNPMLAQNTGVGIPVTQKTVRVSGEVLKDGLPVPNAAIYFFSAEHPLMQVTTSQSDGSFQFEQPLLESGHWGNAKVIATHPLHALGWQGVTETASTGLTIVLSASSDISGTVTDASGKPIADAQIGIVYVGPPPAVGGESPGSRAGLEGDGIPAPSARTDAYGQFRLAYLPEGSQTSLSILSPGYAEIRRFGVPAGTEGLTFALKREGRIEGRVIAGATGASVEGLGVSCQGLHPTTAYRAVSTDAEGKYILTNLPAGEYNVFLNEAPSQWTAVAREYIKVEEGSTVTNMDLTLVEGGFIAVRVTDQDTDDPIAGHSIGFHDASRPESQAAVHFAHTDTNGMLRFRAAPGRAMVYTSAPHGYESVGQVREFVEATTGETVSVGFQFRKGIELTGRVFSIDGTPVPLVKIMDREYGFDQYAITDDEGAFTIAGLRPGQKLSVKLQHPELQLRGTADMEAQPGAEVEILLDRYEHADISGRVVGVQGKPVSSASIQIVHWDSELNRGGGRTATASDGSGNFTIHGLIVGDEYRVTASAEGYREASTDMFVVTSGMPSLPELVLRRAGEFFLEGRVVDTDGNPVARVRLIIQQGGLWEARTDGEGDYRFEQLPCMVVPEVDIDHPDHGFHNFRYIPTNGTRDFVLLKANSYLRGRVLDPEGDPVEQAIVHTYGEQEDASGHVNTGTRTSVQGEFELKNLREGTYRIYVGKGRTYNLFEDVATDQEDVVFVLNPANVPKAPEPSPDRQAEREYIMGLNKRRDQLPGKTAPEIDVAEWLYGGPVQLAAVQGKMVVLHFLRTDRLESMAAIRLGNVLLQHYERQGLVLVGIHTANADAVAVKQAVGAYMPLYPIALDREYNVPGAQGVMHDRYAVGWYPTFVVIDGHGVIQTHAWGGQIEELVVEALSKE